MNIEPNRGCVSTHEFGLIRIGANVGCYRDVLTASSEKGMDERNARRTAASAVKVRAPLLSEKREQHPRELQRWEDDGGSVRTRDAAKTLARFALRVPFVGRRVTA